MVNIAIFDLSYRKMRSTSLLISQLSPFLQSHLDARGHQGGLRSAIQLEFEDFPTFSMYEKSIHKIDFN